MLGGLCACSDQPGASPASGVELLDARAWQQTEAADDPAPDRPQSVECGIAGWYAEGEILEIDTNRCNYAALEQPVRIALAAGGTLHIDWYHFDLTSPEPFEAHAALYLDRTQQWERAVAVPGPGAVYAEQVVLQRAWPTGTTLRWHLHNHGQNSWRLESIRYQAP